MLNQDDDQGGTTGADADAATAEEPTKTDAVLPKPTFVAPPHAEGAAMAAKSAPNRAIGCVPVWTEQGLPLVYSCARGEILCRPFAVSRPRTRAGEGMQQRNEGVNDGENAGGDEEDEEEDGLGKF